LLRVAVGVVEAALLLVLVAVVAVEVRVVY
jgi:hypothetical protein